MTELHGPQVWLEGAGRWAEVPGVTALALEETEPVGLPPDLSLNRSYSAVFWQSPLERALTILAPHLAAEPLYRA